MTKRITVPNPHPLTETIGSISFGAGNVFSIKRGLVATLDAARAETPAALVNAFGSIMGVELDQVKRLPGARVELVVLAAVQVAWYEETTSAVPASCQRTLAKAKEAAR